MCSGQTLHFLYFILFKSQYTEIVMFDMFSFQCSEIEHYLHLFNIDLC